jgi:hypothetical protein
MTLPPARLRSLALIALATAPSVVLAIGPPHARTANDRSASRSQQQAFRPGELIVKYRTGKDATSRDVQAMKAASGLVSRGAMFDGRYERLRLPSALDVRGAMAMLAADPAVEYAEPNYLRRRHAVTPNDPLFASQ